MLVRYCVALAVVSFGMIGAQTKSIPELPRILRHPAPEAPADVASPAASAVEAAPGLWTSVLTAGSGGEHPSGADCAIYRFTAWHRDGTLYSTSGQDGKPATGCLTAMMPGLAKALEAMSIGEQRRVWLSASWAVPFRKSDDGDTDAMVGIPLTVDVALIRILQAPSPPSAAERIHPSPRAVRLQAGSFMEILRHGSGSSHPQGGSTVTVSYTSWDEAGKIVETTVFSGKQVTVPLANVPVGWREALPRMVAGDQVRLWLPVGLVAGQQARALVYDLELIAVQ